MNDQLELVVRFCPESEMFALKVPFSWMINGGQGPCHWPLPLVGQTFSLVRGLDLTAVESWLV